MMNIKLKLQGLSMDQIKHSVTKAQKWAFFSAILWGLIAHIPAIANDILNHDAIGSVDPYSAYNLSSQGKWSAGLMVTLLRGAIAVPSWFVLVGIFLFAISAVLIVRMFKVNSPFLASAISAFLIVYDTIASMTLAYGTDYFALCCLLAVLSAYCVRMWKYGWIPAPIILGFALGGYQPVIAVSAGLLVLLCVQDCFFSDRPFKSIFLRGLIYIATLLVAGIIYYCVMQILISTGNLHLSSYRNVDGISPEVFLDIGLSMRLLKETIEYVYYELAGFHSEPYPVMRTLLPVYGIMTAIIIMLTLINVIKRKERPVKIIIGIILLLVVFPFAANLTDFLTIDNYLSRIMRYGFVLVFLVPIILCDSLHQDFELQTKKKNVIYRPVLKQALCIMCLCLTVNWSCLDHDIYGYVVAANRQMFSKATCLMSSIYDCDDYNTDVSVALIGTPRYPFFEDTGSMTAMKRARALKYGTQGVYSSHDIFYASRLLKTCLNTRLGANFKFIDENSYYDINATQCDEMPIYPNAGSVLYDSSSNTIVVKLSEVEK